jgi:hypothetical protein
MVIVSRSMPILAPNPPPTGHHHADLLRRHAQGANRMNRLTCAFCELAQTVSLPFS